MVKHCKGGVSKTKVFFWVCFRQEDITISLSKRGSPAIHGAHNRGPKNSSGGNDFFFFFNCFHFQQLMKIKSACANNWVGIHVPQSMPCGLVYAKKHGLFKTPQRVHGHAKVTYACMYTLC